MMATFAELLREYRLRPTAMLSQSRLAVLAGYEPSYLNRLESGQRMPSRETVDRLATVLELDERDRLCLFLVAGYVPLDMRGTLLDLVLV